MDFNNLKTSTILKAAGVVLIFIVLISLAFKLVGTSVNSVVRSSKVATQSAGGAMPMVNYYYDDGMAMEESAANVASDLSVRNIYPAPVPGYSTGDDAEAYEVTDYSGTIETGKLAETCAAIAALKAHDYVIFESANEGEKSCRYSFKVTKEYEAEILDVIDSLDPKELIESSYTIKNLVDDYTDELEVLTTKRDSIESTLSDAINSYDEIAKIATSARDAESLAKIIDSKVRIIERLTQEKIEINSHIDRLQRSKADQIDRLNYAYFNLYIFENKFIDGQQVKDSWKQAMREFVRDVNATLQDLSVNLLVLVLRALQVIIYLFILVVAAKYLWRWAKKFWNK